MKNLLTFGLSVTLLAGCARTPISTPTIKPLDTTTPSPTEQTSFTVFASCAPVRLFPNTSSTVVIYLNEGQPVTAHCGVGPDGNWCQVTINDATLEGKRCVPEKLTKQGINLNAFPTRTDEKTGWVWSGCIGMGSECK